MDDQKLYTVRQIAELLNLKDATIIKYIRLQKIGSIIVGRQYRISQEQLDEYYRANTIQRKEGK